ncbi:MULTISPECIES: DUF4102 domain-containing protein [unclassified Neisseria]|uniref:DUF4102 domain-containing protein n=1 Tax=unclassified Neisseria TaxID=2623750 RepID=UPI0018842B1D|nr:DUF4102 domain-containing protein [Neisseria sp. 19428wB4_WF04]
MPLNNRQIKNAKPAEKPYKLADGGGMFLQVTPAGGKLWRLKYRIDGKEKLLSIGKYPAVSLSEARKAAENARRLLAAGQDPAAKQQAKQKRQIALLNTFAAITQQWHAQNCRREENTPDAYCIILKQRCSSAETGFLSETDVFPHIGSHPPIKEFRINDIKTVNRAYRRMGRIGNRRENQAMDRRRFQSCRHA